MGLIKDLGDIYYLTYFEIKEILLIIYHGLEDVNVKELNARIMSRKDEQVRRMARWSMRSQPVGDSEVIRGVPASQGLVKGIARIIKDPGDFHRVRKGDILVAPYTNPAWTPLFTTAAGLLVETGGAASHAAIIARELKYSKMGNPFQLMAPQALFSVPEDVTKDRVILTRSFN